MELNLDPKRTVFLTLYCQNVWAAGIVKDNPECLDRIAACQDAARAGGMEAMHCGIAFPEGFFVVGPHSNFHELWLRDVQTGVIGTPGAEWHPKVAPKPGELSMFSQCSAALVGTPLEQALRGRDVTTVVVTGISTLGSVKNIVTDATNRFFDIIVLSDCCESGNPEVEQVLMQKVFPGICRVATSKDFIESVAAASSKAG